MQIRAWYLPMWVSSERPLTSPIAYSQSRAGDPHPVVDLEIAVRLDPDGRQPELGRARPPADRDQQLVTAQLLAALERQRDLPALAARARRPPSPRCAPRRRRPRARRRPAGSQTAPRRAISRSAASTRVTLAPRLLQGLGELHARQPRRRGSGSRPGTDFAVVACAVGPRGAPPRARRSRDRGASVPVATTTALRARRGRSSPTITVRSPSSAARPRRSSIPRSSSHGIMPLSSRSWMTSSRRASTSSGRARRRRARGRPARAGSRR